MGASPVSFDREVAGLFDFGGASAEDERPHSGAGQLDRGVRLAFWGGVDLPRVDPDSLSNRVVYRLVDELDRVVQKLVLWWQRLRVFTASSDL